MPLEQLPTLLAKRVALLPTPTQLCALVAEVTGEGGRRRSNWSTCAAAFWRSRSDGAVSARCNFCATSRKPCAVSETAFVSFGGVETPTAVTARMSATNRVSLCGRPEKGQSRDSLCKQWRTMFVQRSMSHPPTISRRPRFPNAATALANRGLRAAPASQSKGASRRLTSRA